MLEIPITVLSGDPRQAQNHVPLVPVHQLIDARQNMVDLSWSKEQLDRVTPNLEYPPHYQPEDDLKKDATGEIVSHGSVLG